MKKSNKFIFACIVFAVVGLLALIGQTVYAADMEHCEKECTSCQKSCDKAAGYLKGKSKSAASSAAQKTLADCADMCRTSHNFMERGSAFHPAICKVCVEVCNSCAKACEALKDPELQQCIDECKKCAASCKEMAS